MIEWEYPDLFYEEMPLDKRRECSKIEALREIAEQLAESNRIRLIEIKLKDDIHIRRGK